jgi:hypothetical protein
LVPDIAIDATGISLTVTVDVKVSVQPFLSVAVKVTVFNPKVLYVTPVTLDELFAAVGVALVPNVQSNFVKLEFGVATEVEVPKLKLLLALNPFKHWSAVFTVHFANGCGLTIEIESAVSLHPFASITIN